jgi:hypothetical protein
MGKKDQLLDIIQKGVAFLMEERAYSQKDVVKKLKALEKKISDSLLSNILNQKGEIGFPSLKNAAEGVSEIAYRELGAKFNAESAQFVKDPEPDWEAETIFIKGKTGVEGLRFHWEGRAPLAEKAAFIEGAQHEIIEVGVRVKTFAEYFISRREQEYKQPVMNFLKRGGVFKVYMLDPGSQQARMYFEDRAKAQKSENEALAEMQRVVERLREVAAEMQKIKPGSFEVYFYQHIPYNHFFVADGDQKTGGRMMVSHYLYGVKRADCPVLQFAYPDNPELFRKYRDSLRAYIKDAKRVF